MHRITRIFLALLVLFLASACTAIPVDERASMRTQLLDTAEETRALFVAENPSLASDMENAAGFLVASISGGQAPILGGGYGRGVLVDNSDGSRMFMNVSRFDLGAGLGLGEYRVLVLLESRETLEAVRSGGWRFGLGAAMAADDSGGALASWSGDGFRLLAASVNGAIVAASARAVRFSVNTDLTDVGVSEVSIPATGFTAAEEKDEEAPRTWNHKLPFMAQKVVDLGYDLPLPYGAGLIYAYNEQDQVLTDLEVGINGRDKTLFPFVGFDRSLSKADSPGAKVDAWLFPFLNVYANFGSIEGDAAIDILIDGNGMLDHLGLACDGVIKPGLCERLMDQNFLLPIYTSFSGKTWGVGATLAGGWNNWFVAIPFNFSRLDLDTSNADGGPIITVAPRFGRTFNIGRWGNLSLFAGGNYLDAELTISGTYRVGSGEEELTFDYTVQQENKDNWNLLAGFNWDVSKRFSWSLEYDGFIGSRVAIVGTATWRF